MTQITLSPDQTAQLAAATDGVVITDSDGNVVVRLAGRLTDEEREILANHKRQMAANVPTRPFSEVIAELKAKYPVDEQPSE
ncbi:MAG: hypothetical protein AAGJ46_11395 [Planctomycetota bacterium]